MVKNVKFVGFCVACIKTDLMFVYWGIEEIYSNTTNIYPAAKKTRKCVTFQLIENKTYMVEVKKCILHVKLTV